MNSLKTFLRKHTWFVAGGCVVLLAVVGLAISWWPGPARYVYQGRTVQEWSSRLFTGEPASDEATAALRAMGPKAVPDLVRGLRATDPLLHAQLRALVPRLPLAIRRKLGPYLVRPAATATRREAARALGVIGSPARGAIPALLKALRSPDEGFAWEAALALTHFGQEAVPGLVQAMGERKLKSRHAIVYALGEIRPPPVEAVPALVKALEEPGPGVRASAANSLANIGLPAVPALAEVVAHGQGEARDEAAKALVRIYGAPRAAASSPSQAGNEGVLARTHAITALGQNGTPDALVLAVWRSALNDPAAEVRLAALQHWGGRLAQSTNAGIANSSPGQAAGTAPGQPPFIEVALCLEDQSLQVRASAIRCLGLMGPAAQPAVPTLERLLADKEEPIRAAAREALERIRGTPGNGS